MEYVGVSRGSIRGEALKKLVKLSIESHSRFEVPKEQNLLRRFIKDHKDGNCKAPMKLREFELLLAFCDAVKSRQGSIPDAHAVLEKFGNYLQDAPRMEFSVLIHRKCIKSSSWRLITSKLATAVISISLNNKHLVEECLLILESYIEATLNQKNKKFTEYHSLLGFLEAFIEVPKFLTDSPKAFKILTKLNAQIDNEVFLNGVEEATLRVSTRLFFNFELEKTTASAISPVLFLQHLGELMSRVSAQILATDDPLSYVLQKLAENYEDEDEEPVNIDDFGISKFDLSILEVLVDLAIRKMEVLDRGESCLVYSSLSRLKTGYLTKSYYLQIIAIGTVFDLVHTSTSKAILSSCLSIQSLTLDPDIGLTVFQLGAILVFKDYNAGPYLTRSFTSLVADPGLEDSYCHKISKIVGLASKVMLQDSVVTTIYALTNLLFSFEGILHARNTLRRNGVIRKADTFSLVDFGQSGGSKAISRTNSDIEKLETRGNEHNSSDNSRIGDYLKVCDNAIVGISEISKAYNDENVTTLAVTILSQKLTNLNPKMSKVLLKGLISCAPYLPEREFIILSKLLSKRASDASSLKKKELLNYVLESRIELSRLIKVNRNLFMVCLQDLLQNIISKGNVQELEHHRSHNEISNIAEQLGLYLKPLAELLPDNSVGEPPLELSDTSTINLFRNIWFNMVVHGYSANSAIAKSHMHELQRIAYSTPPLASELSWDKTETSLELNTVLRRGSSNHNVKNHKQIVDEVFLVHRVLSYPKLMFLAATVFCEGLRVKSGNCYRVLQYHSDPSIRNSGVEKYIDHISLKIVQDFIKLARCGMSRTFNQEVISNQLSVMLTLCCHRSEDLQNCAIQCCDMLITRIPSSLCHKRSLFSLFDILCLLYDSVIDADVNEYDPTTTYDAKITGIKILLSDSYKWRLDTFNRFHEKAKIWMRLILTKSNFDIKALISAYVSDLDSQWNGNVHFGISFALSMAGSVLNNDRELSNAPKFIQIDTLPEFVSQLTWRNNFFNDILEAKSIDDERLKLEEIRRLVINSEELIKSIKNLSQKEVHDLLNKIAVLVLVADKNSAELIRYIVAIPFSYFNSTIISAAFRIWLTAMRHRQDSAVFLLGEIACSWEQTIKLRKGLFSTDHDINGVEYTKMEYNPSDNSMTKKISEATNKIFEPHLLIIKLFASNFEASLNQSPHLLMIFTRFVLVGLRNMHLASLHPYSRAARFELIRFAFDILSYHIRLGSKVIYDLTESIMNAILSWFKGPPRYPFGSNILRVKADLSLLQEVSRLISHAHIFGDQELEIATNLAEIFINDEINRILVWLSPLRTPDLVPSKVLGDTGIMYLRHAFKIDAILAINFALRFNSRKIDGELQTLISQDPVRGLRYPVAVQYWLGVNFNVIMPTYHLLLCKPASPVDAIMLFLPPYGDNPFVLQYAMRSLQYHDVNLTFFYVPQIVQSLRFDSKGYVERFIIETARVSQQFAHQIIWNMLANSYKDEDSTIPDSLKPVLDRTQKEIVSKLDKRDYWFYEKEFGFFNEVTSISGKLKPYIKKSKAEKKLKIDEEMAKIKIEPDVYLPSNPDGVVVDINRKSGKPLQSHAKAPFMATFKIRKEVKTVDDEGNEDRHTIEKWQSAIFKVGDDCRQDVLALQLISVFRTIWANAGLDLFVYPYRVTATAPGCGVIDVLPNSISRDMLGREAVNGLYEYFTTKFGPENSVEFQHARNNLIRSLAAYSIISYLLQFKDRHNGNIMYDDQGHILHIDFGFCFDIVPGGVKFEVAPFKLTHEMVLVLGGSSETQAFKWFEELCVKGYLACRPYMETIVRAVIPMLQSGLPCFKDSTIRKLRSRFVPSKTDHDAAVFMRHLIRKSLESFYTKGYDEFQRLTNGIPY